MASRNLDPESIRSLDSTEKFGIAGERDVGRSHVKTDSPRSSRKTEEKEESFMASDLFFQKMGTMINKQDVQSILDKQTETLKKFEKTNAKFGKFNDLSAARYLHLNQQVKNYTKMLLDMKKDLDSVFRRIRNLKTKLTKQYGPAFYATSAGIQKLEEELGASIENEDSASLSTLTESKELSCDSQSPHQGLAVMNKGSMQQKIKESINQSSDLSIKNKSAATGEAEFQLQGSDKSSLSSSFQVNKVMNRTEDLEDVTRTVKITDMKWTVDTGNSVQTEDTSCKTETVDTDHKYQSEDTDDTVQTVDTTGKTETVDTYRTYQREDTCDKTETVDTDHKYQSEDTDDTVQTVDTTGKTETVDTYRTYQREDTCDKTETVDMSVMHQTPGSASYSSETVDTHDMTQCKEITGIKKTVDTSGAIREGDASDKSQSEDTYDMSQTLDTSKLSEGGQ